jgi:two-component system sensor histidine kinase/response regulator
MNPAADAGNAELQRSELRYRRLFEAAQDGILLLNAETGRIEDANPYLTHMLGYTHDEMLGKMLWEVGAFGDIAKSAEMFEQLRQEGYVRYDDMPLRTRKGLLINVEFISNAYDCAGVQVIQCNVRNITEQRLAEEQVRKLSEVVEQSPMATVVSDLSGHIEYVNAALLEGSGYRSDELLGRSVRMLQSDATPAATLADLAATVGQGRVWRGEFTCQRKDGSGYTAGAIVAPILRADGTVSHHVTITEDITARQRDARELARHRDALEVLIASRTHQLADAMVAAQAANIAKSRFLANMSHEIRTPLSAITGLAYLLRRTPLTDQQADWLRKLDLAGVHLLDLINAVLDLSKIEAGKLALDAFDVPVSAIVARVVSMLADRAAAKHLRVGVDVQALPPGLVGDPARLQQALLNYADNAIKFTSSGSVTLRVRCVDETADTALIRFEVQDTGIGIPAEVLPRLFTAFEQADSSTTRQHGGTGLGLVIVRQLSRMMGGDAGADSTEGSGSTFWFTARLTKLVRLGTPGSPPVGGLAEAALARDHAATRVLVADDDEVGREVTVLMLSEVFPRIDQAANGADAVRLATEHPYGLILMDMQMPGFGGIEATRRIRQLPGASATAIVALTANAFAEDRAACLAAGMDDFLTKPLVAEALFQILLEALTRRR